MNLSKYSIFKLGISPISKDKYGRDEYNLECIKKIDGELLRKTITVKQTFMKFDNTMKLLDLSKRKKNVTRLF